jgi:hypothetical protein
MGKRAMKRKTTGEEARERLAALRRDRAAEAVARYGGLLDGLFPSGEASEAPSSVSAAEPWFVVAALIPGWRPEKRPPGRPPKAPADRSGRRKGNLLEPEEFIKPASVKRQARRVRQRERDRA